MRIRDAVRIAVVFTNPLWPFSLLNKIPYRIALRAFIMRCARYPHIKSIYIRHSFAGNNWLPALSDIDMTIIIEGGLTHKVELAFLNSFWKTYGKIKKFFPMLGEITILSTDDLEKWPLLSRKIGQSDCWKLVYGNSWPAFERTPCRNPRQMLYYAYAFYYEYLSKKFFSDGVPGHLFLKEINRATQKVATYVCYGSHGPAQQAPKTIYDCFSFAIRMLHEASPGSRQPKLSENTVAFIPENEDFFIPIKKHIPTDALFMDHRKKVPDFVQYLLRYAGSEILSMLFLPNGNRIYIVIDSALSEERAHKLITVVRKGVLNYRVFYPFIGTAQMLRESIVTYNPLWYYYLMHKGKVVYGRDIISELCPPDGNTLDQHLLIKAAYAPIRLRNYPQNNISYMQWLLGPSAYYYIEELLQMKLFFETGYLETSSQPLIERYEKYYPELRRISDPAIPSDFEAAALANERFSLIKAVLKDLDVVLTQERSQEAKNIIMSF